LNFTTLDLRNAVGGIVGKTATEDLPGSSFSHSLDQKAFYHTSTGPFGTGICSRVVEAGSRMKEATIGGC
jgi:hypothetical protein